MAESAQVSTWLSERHDIVKQTSNAINKQKLSLLTRRTFWDVCLVNSQNLVNELNYVKEMRAAFNAENVTSGRNRLLLTATVAASKNTVDSSYEISLITQ